MIILEDFGEIFKIPEKFCFIWKLPNCFAYEYANDDDTMIPHIVNSPCFCAFHCKWRLTLLRNQNQNEDSIEYVSLFLSKVSPIVIEKLDINVSSCIYNSEGKLFADKSGSIDICGDIGWWNFLSLKTFSEESLDISLNGYLRFGCLMVKSAIALPMPELCVEEIKNGTSVVSVNMVEQEIPELQGVDKLVEDLKNLLTDKESCDVVLKVEDSEFKAHRSILIARSPVFGSMFRHDTEEKVTGEVNIPDCSAAAFEFFLLYLYTGNMDIISSENVSHLYYAADKYLIKDLKLECVKYMEENLSVENFCAIMTLTMQYSEPDLLEKAAAFFCDNIKEIVKTVQWQKYLKDYPIQANELFIKSINA